MATGRQAGHRPCLASRQTWGRAQVYQDRRHSRKQNCVLLVSALESRDRSQACQAYCFKDGLSHTCSERFRQLGDWGPFRCNARDRINGPEVLRGSTANRACLENCPQGPNPFQMATDDSSSADLKLLGSWFRPQTDACPPVRQPLREFADPLRIAR